MEFFKEVFVYVKLVTEFRLAKLYDIYIIIIEMF
jgi:hypothetical protein